MSDYYVRDYYWVVSGDETRVYSSAMRGFVSATDLPYRDFLASGQIAAHIASEVELYELLEQQYPAGLPFALSKDVSKELNRRLALAINAATGKNYRPEDIPRVLERTNREASRLLDKRLAHTEDSANPALSAQEQARVVKLRQVDAVVDGLEAKRDAVLALDPVPVDYQSDGHWV